MRTDQNTGRAIGELEHIRQSIRDIITTPLGSRVMRPDYGCSLLDYVDGKIGPTNELRISQAVHSALEKWERRVRVLRTEVADFTVDGHFSIFVYLENEETVEVRV